MQVLQPTQFSPTLPDRNMFLGGSYYIAMCADLEAPGGFFVIYPADR